VRRRALTVALAVLLAVLGTTGVMAYVRQADTRAIAGMKAVSVLVATRLIPAGTSAGAAEQAGLLSGQKLPAGSVPADAVLSLTPGLSSLVMSADVQPGQLLLRPMLVAAAQVTSGLPIPAGMVAVTVQVCLPEAVAGYLHPGSQVAVFDTLAPGGASNSSSGGLTAQPNCSGPHTQQQLGAARTRIMLPKVQVLAVGQAGGQSQAKSTGFGASSSATTQNTVLVTLAVSQPDAERLILLAETGLPYLALLTDSSRTGPDTGAVPRLPR
jgi:pilus assembly protein CpaB